MRLGVCEYYAQENARVIQENALKLEAVRRLVTMIAKGKSEKVSRYLFPSVVKCVVPNNPDMPSSSCDRTSHSVRNEFSHGTSPYIRKTAAPFLSYSVMIKNNEKKPYPSWRRYCKVGLFMSSVEESKEEDLDLDMDVIILLNNCLIFS